MRMSHGDTLLSQVMTARGQYWQFKYLSLPAWCGFTPTGMRNERHHTVNKELICRDHRPQKIYLGNNKSFHETLK